MWHLRDAGSRLLDERFSSLCEPEGYWTWVDPGWEATKGVANKSCGSCIISVYFYLSLSGTCDRNLHIATRSLNTMYIFFILVLLSSLAIAQNPYCLPASPPASLPACTVSHVFLPHTSLQNSQRTLQRSCLDKKDTDGTCADNLRGFCDLPSGVHAFVKTYGDCLMKACNDDDKYSEWEDGEHGEEMKLMRCRLHGRVQGQM